MTFSKLKLSPPILDAVTELGYETPTAIQKKAIPAILSGRDLIASAQTGTGKTASFVLPLLEMLKSDKPSEERKRRAKRLRALILVPTRELAVQVENNICQYGKYLDVKSMAMFGGVDSEAQKQQLIEGIDILVATPGRLLDMAHQRALHFDELKVLVLDEADRMLDMGFIGDINKIIDRLPGQRQNLLFSATMPDGVRLLADTAIENPVEVSIADNSATTPQISQWVVSVDKDKKSTLLSHLIKEHQWTQALVFIRTKHGAAKLVSQLEKRGIKAESIHSGRSQAVRTQILADFKSGEIGILVATGIASRGIDIDELTRVVNYDLPDDADDYIHRIGRTGRAGACGEAVSLVSMDDFKRLCAIERRLDQIIDRRKIEGFITVKELPESNLNYAMKEAPVRKKKPALKGKDKPNSSRRKKTSESSSTNTPDSENPWLRINKK
ncbi:DEAD/DEAH box helicase [Gammaproteobacteria bacterium 42_54_T18]|nr:DEAD/DEAH box helicase [Gammaproteobacteria bacterium 42_54_T18]